MSSKRIKLCSKCREYLSVRLFRVNKRNKNGLNATCNTCLLKKKDSNTQSKLKLMKFFWQDEILKEQYEAIIAGQQRGNTCWRPECFAMQVPHDD